MVCMNSKNRRFGWIMALAAPWLAFGCATTRDAQHPLLDALHHRDKEPLTVMVTGLVKKQSTLEIPHGGLTLKDAVALAGGDIPAQLFPGTNPSNVVVSLQRPASAYHFALPLVTGDLAGRIFLIPGDKVSLQLDANTDMGRSVVRSADSGPDAERQNREQWRSILNRDDVGEKPLEYDVKLRDLDGTERTMTILVQAAEQPRNAPADAAALGVGPAPALKIQIAGSPNVPNLRNANGSLRDATLASVSEISETRQDMSVMVLERQVQGRVHQFVLLRPGSIATANNQRSAVEKVLKDVTLIPDDVVATLALIQLPIVKSSLATPKLYDFVARREEFCPKVAENCQTFAAALSPVTDPIRRITALALSPLEGISYGNIPPFDLATPTIQSK